MALRTLQKLFAQHPVGELVDLGFTPPAVPLSFDLDKDEDEQSGCHDQTESYAPFVVVEGNLGIPANAVEPLYRAAYQRFFELRPIINQVELDDQGRTDLLLSSQALLLINPELITAWNARKHILSMTKHVQSSFAWHEELALVDLILSKHPKRASVWAHRWWVLSNGMELTEARLMHEWRICLKACDRHRMNYNAWTYRRKLLPAVNSTLLKIELHCVAVWIRGHVSDHRRTAVDRLRHLYRLESEEISRLLESESNLARELISAFPGHASPWSYLQVISIMQLSSCNSTNIECVPTSYEIQHAMKSDVELFTSVFLSNVRFASCIVTAHEERKSSSEQLELALAFLYCVFNSPGYQDLLQPVSRRLIDLDYNRRALIDKVNI